MRFGGALLFALLALTMAGGASAEGPNAVLPFVGCGGTTLPRNDDGSSPAVALPFGVNFFGANYNTIWVNNNGNVTFNGPLSAYIPFDLTSTRVPIIAVMLADVDTRPGGAHEVTYGNVSVGETVIGGHEAFCVNWVDVGEYSFQDVQRNSAQLLLVDRSDTGAGNFDIWMNYDKIQWDHGGIGVGYSDGTGNPAAFFDLPGSRLGGAFLDSNPATGLIYNNNNAPLQPGRYIYPVRNGAYIGHSIAGHVWENAVGTPAANAFLQACTTDAPTTICRNASTNSSGAYVFNNLPDSSSGAADYHWNIVAYPPSGSGLSTGSIGPVHVAGVDIDNQDVVLHGPLPLPAGASVITASRGVATSGTPTVYWQDAIGVSFTGCIGGSGTATMTVEDGYTQTITLVEGPPGTYTGSFLAPYPHHGATTITFSVCGSPGSFNIYIDPSGFVRTLGGAPISGATVVLYRSDEAVGPFVQVPNGSALMSPANRHNPDTTDATGHFGWDVLAGFYRVRASKAGCTGPGGADYVESAVMAIPPPVTDLDLRLDCGLPADVTPPAIDAHADVIAEATSAAGALVSYTTPAAHDDTDASVAVSCSPPSGGQFPLGPTTILCSATDAAGNVGHSSFAVRVADTTAPGIGGHPDVLAHATSGAGAIVSYTSPSAHDAVSGDVAVTCAPASGAQFALGSSTVQCTATDAAGNIGHSSFAVNVVDVTAPVLTTPAGPIVVNATSPAGAVVAYSASASDAVSGSVTPSCSPASGGTFAIGNTTVRCTATDAAGNRSAEKSFTVHVKGAAEQLGDLRQWVLAGKVGPGSSLSDKLADAAAAASSGAKATACSGLNSLENEVRAQTGKKVSADQAAKIRADVARIRAVLAC